LPSCLIVKCTGGGHSNAPELSEALRIARKWMGESGLLALLSDTQPAGVKRFVNVNNFLAETGVIERDERSGQINWPGSLAYFAGHGQLWVNLIGRDPQGVVYPQDEYEEVRDTLVKVLPAKLLDAGTGESMIERLYRKEELYAAEYLFCAPDLVVLFRPGYAPSPRSIRIDFDETTLTTPATGATTMAGVHPSMLGGFLLASAPALARGISLPERVSLTAVLPTLLHALGVEISDVDSAAASALFDPSYLETHPIRSGLQSQELSEEDEELIINRLRDLGYV
jgi:predicted AlkP superfamily phosphohydrolase/phosphomutase